jgi:hypothetical protein
VLGGAIALLGPASPAVAAPAWLPPTALSAPGRDASAVSVEMDDAGDTVAVWQRARTSGPGSVIQASTRRAGAAFSAPIELSPVGSEPALAMSPSGEAIVIWRELQSEVEELGEEEFLNTSSRVLRASVMSPAGSFSPAFDVYRAPPTIIKVVDSIPQYLQNGANPQRMRLAINAAGAAVLAWQESDPEEPATTVMASLRGAGGAFGSATRISPPPTALHPAERAEVAIDADADATVVWQYREGATTSIVQSSTAPAAGPFGGPETLNGALGAEETATSPGVASSAAGETTVIWDRSAPAESVVEIATRSPGGGFGEPGQLSTLGDAAFAPRIVVAPNGEALAVWLVDAEPNVVQAAGRPPGGSFDSPVTISGPDSDAEFPNAVIGSTGAAAVAWSAGADEPRVLEASVRPAGGGFGAGTPISAPGAGIFQSDLGIDASGDVTVGWQHSNGSNAIAEVAGYDAFAPQLRDVSIPATATVGEVLTFAANPFDVWPTGPASFNFGDGTAASGNSVQHTYTAPGTYRVDASVADPAGTVVSQSGQVVVRPRGTFTIGKLLLDKKKGTAKLPVTVDGPGAVSVRGKGVKSTRVRAGGPVSVKVPIKTVGSSSKKLKKKGKLKISLTVTFSPDGGQPASKPAKGTLRKKQG